MFLHQVWLFASNSSTTPEQSFWQDWELTQPWATVIGGVIVAGGAFLGFYASIRARKTMEQTALDTDIRERHTAQLVHAREVQSARQARYTTVAEQMASDQAHVRLAGIYALSALADEWQEDDEYGQRNVCVELLCAYLRSKPRPEGDDEARGAVIVAISEHTGPDAEYPWPGAIIDLADADLSWTTLRGLDLSGASFRRADFSRAMIIDCKMAPCLFINTIFDGASLHNVDLSGSAMDVSQAHGAYFINCKFDMVSLWGMRVGNANFRGSDLSSAIFGRMAAKDWRADLVMVAQTDSGLEAVTWDSATLWPWWFDPEAAIRQQAALFGALGASPPPGAPGDRQA